MRHSRFFQFRGVPYRRFFFDLALSAVLVVAVGMFLLNLEVSAALTAAACGATAAFMVRMIHLRVVRERARNAPAHRPRMSRLMERYGVAPRRQPATRSMA